PTNPITTPAFKVNFMGPNSKFPAAYLFFTSFNSSKFNLFVSNVFKVVPDILSSMGCTFSKALSALKYEEYCQFTYSNICLKISISWVSKPRSINLLNAKSVSSNLQWELNSSNRLDNFMEKYCN